jgi:GNAT superfamily N-acetyltransferase
MTALLWLDTGADEAVPLGGTLQLYVAFKAWSDAAGGWASFQEDWPALAGLMDQVESQEDADPDWTADLQAEAELFEGEHPGLDSYAAAVLQLLVDAAPVSNYNPYHGEGGRFASADASAGRLEHVEALFGSGVSFEDVARAAGAMHSSAVSVATEHDAHSGAVKVSVKVKHPDYECERKFERDDAGSLIVNNVFFEARTKGAGVGTAVLSQQVQECRRIGVSRMLAVAVGDAHSTANGYYTWPLMGYNGELDAQHKSRMDDDEVPEKYMAASTIRELMSMPGGRQVWKRSGSSIDVEFDLHPDSQSSRQFEAYLEERRNRGLPS